MSRRHPDETPASDADEQLVKHIRDGAQPDPDDDVAVLLAMLRDEADPK